MVGILENGPNLFCLHLLGNGLNPKLTGLNPKTMNLWVEPENPINQETEPNGF